jgi:hypothetical protein
MTPAGTGRLGRPPKERGTVNREQGQRKILADYFILNECLFIQAFLARHHSEPLEHLNSYDAYCSMKSTYFFIFQMLKWRHGKFK